ncbi:hypothetical protein CDAR_551531 [Caerostris darwini]|uniref:Uncharacterized protein n=1 Tax=Caerostris darwini TaxID=1538125 RepID=A0AAV4V5Z2_9ARAC|nr:hypothetical protein CDAR_551531 [Caerostris darwini]
MELLGPDAIISVQRLTFTDNMPDWRFVDDKCYSDVKPGVASERELVGCLSATMLHFQKSFCDIRYRVIALVTPVAEMELLGRDAIISVQRLTFRDNLPDWWFVDDEC